jgi:hypothetical protein
VLHDKLQSTGGSYRREAVAKEQPIANMYPLDVDGWSGVVVNRCPITPESSESAHGTYTAPPLQWALTMVR